MSEWLKELPWGKIGAVAGTALAAALGGTLHFEGDKTKEQQRFYHRPSGQWADQWRWLYCAH